MVYYLYQITTCIIMYFIIWYLKLSLPFQNLYAACIAFGIDK